ncbi:MAG: acyl-CoA carboxylase subunit beta, partial [Bacteroidota bacterium]
MDIQFNKNEDENKQLIYRLNERLKKVKDGGGEKKVASQHKKGKLTARERIGYLLDNDEDFLEIGAFAAEGMYQEVG